MPTAIEKFLQHDGEIDRLQVIHGELSGSGPGRRRDLEVLHKAAFVLITAFWEAFCEDLASEAIEHILEHAQHSRVLPNELRKQIAKELKAESHELAVWELADDHWRRIVRGRLAEMMIERNRRLNTPKTEQIKDLFFRSLGIDDLPASWHWSGMTHVRAVEKLDSYITTRGAIAHRGEAEVTIRLAEVRGFRRHVGFLAGRTQSRVAGFLLDVTEVPFG